MIRRSSELDVGNRFKFHGSEYLVKRIEDFTEGYGNNYVSIVAESNGHKTWMALRSSTLVQVIPIY